MIIDSALQRIFHMKCFDYVPRGPNGTEIGTDYRNMSCNCVCACSLIMFAKLLECGLRLAFIITYNLVTSL